MPTRSEVTGIPELSADALRKFQASVQGEVFQPGHPGYDPARRIHNAMIDRRPALIVRCREVSDVLRSVEFARGIEVDPAAGTARAQGGLTWGEFDRKTQDYGLATTGGFISSTGIAGLTLGGGLGWLMRKYGLACDNLRSVEIVTADGQLLTANTTQLPDLFWAVRGGGGNFGIVTSFEYQLHPVGQLLAGVVFFPLEQAQAALRFYRGLRWRPASRCCARFGASADPRQIWSDRWPMPRPKACSTLASPRVG